MLEKEIAQWFEVRLQSIYSFIKVDPLFQWPIELWTGDHISSYPIYDFVSRFLRLFLSERNTHSFFGPFCWDFILGFWRNIWVDHDEHIRLLFPSQEYFSVRGDCIVF